MVKCVVVCSPRGFVVGRNVVVGTLAANGSGRALPDELEVVVVVAVYKSVKLQSHEGGRRVSSFMWVGLCSTVFGARTVVRLGC
jgi:fructose-1,6-bisphosphatase